MRVVIAAACALFCISFYGQNSTSAQGGVNAPKATGKTGDVDSPVTKQGKRKTQSLQDVLPTPTTKIQQASLNSVVSWTRWNGLEAKTLVPKPTIESLGNDLCPKTKNPTAEGTEGYDPKIKDFCSFKKDVYVIQVINLKRVEDKKGTELEGTETDNSKIELEDSQWYLYKPGTGAANLQNVQAVDGKFPPLVGGHTGVIISVALLENPICTLPFTDKGSCEKIPNISYEVKLTEKTAANITALQSLLNGVLGLSKPLDATKFTGTWDEKSSRPKFEGLVTIYELDGRRPVLPFDWSITSTVTIAEAAPIKKQLSIASAEMVKPEFMTLSADTAPPADPKTKKYSYTHTVSENGRQYWNVGINITPHGPRENKYALSTSNIVTQSHTIHSPFYAALDFSPWPQRGYRPYFQAGIPLSGAAFHLPFVSVSEPLPFTKKILQLSVYVGAVFMQQTFPRTLAVGTTSNTAAFNADLQTDRAIKPIFGIEVPVTSIISKVKSSVGAGK